jgi:DNA-binding MarR family transcriptional regulator
VYDVGEIVVGGVLLSSAYGLVRAADFNNNVINKPKRSNMLDTTALKKAWNEVLVLRAMNDELHLSDGKLLTDIEFAMLCHVAHQNGKVNITSIVNHPYFSVASLSTVKRAVARLIGENLIYVVNTSHDKRERMLAVKESDLG